MLGVLAGDTRRSAPSRKAWAAAVHREVPFGEGREKNEKMKKLKYYFFFFPPRGERVFFNYYYYIYIFFF